MSITALLDTPFYTGGASSSLVPGKFPVALAGRPYLLDEKDGAWEHQSIPLMRYQVDQSETPGEQSINPHGLWRRTTEDWSSGSGQLYQDHKTSDGARYSTSKGIDPWTTGQISLLNDTELKRSSLHTNLQLVVAGTYLYLLEGDTLYYTTDITSASPSWVHVLPAGSGIVGATSITSDGNRVWISDATDTYYTTRGSSTYSLYLAGQSADVIAYVKGRLIGTLGNDMFEYGAQGLAVNDMGSTLNTDFKWVAFAEGPQGIYAAGYSGDKSTVYIITVDTTTTALGAPTAASDLPDGEIVRSLQGYLGFLLIGTDLGFRTASTASSGSINLGDLIPTTPVFCFEPQDRFVWFGWSNYDSDSTGLGRVDLRTATATNTYAYASDLMASTQGDVTSVATFQNIRVFCVSGEGVYAQTTNYVASGQIVSSLVSFGLSDQKTALYLETQNRTGGGSVQAALAIDGTTHFTNVGGNFTAAQSGVHTASLGQNPSELFTIRHTLTRDADPGVTPIISRWTLLADVHAQRRVQINVPLLLHTNVSNLDGEETHVDVRFERQQIKALFDSRQVVTYQEGLDQYSVIVEDFDWKPYRSEGFSEYEHSGTLILNLRTV